MEEDIDNINWAEDEDEDDEGLYDPNDPNAPKKKKKKKIKLTEKEVTKIKQTIEEMKENQVQPQKSGGKVFTGPGFASNPSKIIYKDFEIGKKMSITIEITNISYSFNSFHLQPLDDEIIDFFEIDYMSCGRIPAGISTKMTLHFTPLVNKDYKSHLKLLSETGLCLIPLECYCKKCLISFEKEEIDYGEVILGQEVIKPLIVNNNGALNCKYTVVDSKKNLFINEEDDDEDNDKDPDLDPSYKDFNDRKIILHKNDYLNENKGTCETVIDEIKKEKVEKYKEDLINQEKENIEQKEKEKEEEEKSQAQNVKGKKPAPPKKKNPKDKEPEVELINGLPKEIMDEIDKKVEEYSKSYTIQTEEEQKLFEEKDKLLKAEKNKKFLLKQIKIPLRGQFNGYSKKKISIILNANYIGEFKINAFYKIEYKNQIEYKQFVISFNVVDLPIYSENKIYELNHIIYDQIFREKVVLVNNSSASFKLQVFFHKDLKDYIELNPNLGYIQPNSKFDIWVKLKVDTKIKGLIYYFKGKNTEDNIEYNFPLKIVLNNVKIPLITVLHFFTTTDKINISEKTIEFGKRPVDEKTKVKLFLENLSLLPMKYGFIMLPKEFSARENVNEILPKEKVGVDIIYQSKDNFTGHREGDIFCKVVTNELTCQNIKIPYHIELYNPEIKIKPKLIKFQSLPEGESEEVQIFITNQSNSKTIDCEFMTPPKCISGLTIMPKVFTLGPSSYTTCVMRFEAMLKEYDAFSYEEIEKEIGIKLSDGIGQMEKEVLIEGNENKLVDDKVKKEIEETLNKQTEGTDKKKKGGNVKEQPKKDNKKEQKKDKKALEEEERIKKEEEEKRLKEIEDKKQERIKTFKKEDELKYFGAENIFNNIENDRSSHWKFIIPLFYKIHKDKNETNKNESPIKTTFIEVQTTIVEKVLVFDKEVVDFGEVSVQNRKIINVFLTNNSDKIAKIKMKPLIITKSFSIVNAIRDIPPYKSFNFIIEFIPQKDIPYCDALTVYTNETQSTIQLKGIGVMPEVETNVPDGILFMGNSVANNTIEKTFDINNLSHFSINFTIKTLKFGKKNKTGIIPFCYIPYCGEITANGKATIKVIFNGDHQDFENYFDFILIDVPNQKKENKIILSAFCWNRQVYWKEFSEHLFPDEEFMNKIIEQDVFVDCLNLESLSPSSNNNKIKLVFTRETKSTENQEQQKENVDPNENKSPNVEEDEKCFKRKIIIGNCKMNDPKNEKNGGYEIIMDKDNTYFSCDNPKGAVNSGQEVIITFSFKKPSPDPITSSIKCLKSVGTWITSVAELKINGGFIQPNSQDAVSVGIVLKAYIEQI